MFLLVCLFNCLFVCLFALNTVSAFFVCVCVCVCVFLFVCEPKCVRA